MRSLRSAHAWNRPVRWIVGSWVLSVYLAGLFGLFGTMTHVCGGDYGRLTPGSVALIPIDRGALIVRTRFRSRDIECWGRWIPSYDVAERVLERDIGAGYKRSSGIPWWGGGVVAAVPIDRSSQDSYAVVCRNVSLGPLITVVDSGNAFVGLLGLFTTSVLISTAPLPVVLVLVAALYELQWLPRRFRRWLRRRLTRRYRLDQKAGRCHRCSFEAGDLERIRFCPECGHRLLKADHGDGTRRPASGFKDDTN
ncbi:MAG: hypothetical protein AAGI53_00930 [Planctomycetota bacterium]